MNPTEPTSSGPDRRTTGATAFVWAVWATSTAASILYVVAFAADVPRWDDYAVVPQLCGRSPITAEWLWSQHSEHRIPIARLVLLGTFWLDGADPRPVMFLIVTLLAGGTAALLAAAGRTSRGRTYADAFLPLTMLGLAHHENLLWAIQITYVLPVALLCLAAALASTAGERPGLKRSAAVGAYLALMPLCNAGGLLMIPAPAAWLLAMAAAEWRSGRPNARARALLTAACAVPALLIGLFYLHGYTRPTHHAPPAGPVAAIRTALQFLTTGLGPAAVPLWPWSGAFVGATAASTIVVLLVAWSHRRGERARIEGLVAVLGSVGLVALATGWGRSGEGPLAGLQARYVTLAAPAMALGYLALKAYGGRFVGTLATLVLFAAACVLAWPNAAAALAVGRTSAESAARFDRDRDRGEPLFRLVKRHVPYLHPSQQSLHEMFAMLQGRQVGGFRRMRPDPTFVERPLELRPVEVRMGRWEGNTIVARGVDPWARFDLPENLHVAGVRIRYDHENEAGGPARFRLAWKLGGRYGVPETQYGEWNLPTGEDRTVTVWVDEPIGLVRIQPDNQPCRFRIRELVLLLEPGSAGDAAR